MNGTRRFAATLVLGVLAAATPGCQSDPAPLPPATRTTQQQPTEQLPPEQQSPEEQPPEQETSELTTLLDHVPPEYASSCAEISSLDLLAKAPSQAVFGLTGALECHPLGDPQELLYLQYNSTGRMNEALQAYIDETAEAWGAYPDEGNCQESFFQAGQYRIDGELVGDLVCFSYFTAESQWQYAWTNWNTNILAVVNDIHWYPADFYQWWVNYAASTA